MVQGKLSKLAPFLLIDGALILMAYVLLNVDWMVNHTLYEYGLIFSEYWYYGYKVALNTILGLLLSTITAVTILGLLKYRKTKVEIGKTVFICKSCGNALSKPEYSINTKHDLPEFRVIKKCPICDEKLVEK